MSSSLDLKDNLLSLCGLETFKPIYLDNGLYSLNQENKKN